MLWQRITSGSADIRGSQGLTGMTIPNSPYIACFTDDRGIRAAHVCAHIWRHTPLRSVSAPSHSALLTDARC